MATVGPCQANSIWQPSKDALGPVSSSFTTSIWNKPRVLQGGIDEGRGTMAFTAALRGTTSPSSSELVLTSVGSSPRTCTDVTKSMVSTTPHGDISSSTLKSRRAQRYTLAEHDLTSKLQRCNAELSPRELQIRALEKATAMLSAHAHDSRQRVDKLRRMLANHNLDPTAYQKLKHERWMEERRHVVVDLDKKAALQQLQQLLSHPEHDSPVSFSTQSDHYASRLERSHINLSKFLQSSPVYPPVRLSKFPLAFTQRHFNTTTLTRTSSLRLRVTSSTNSHNRADARKPGNSLENNKRHRSRPVQLGNNMRRSSSDAGRNADALSLSEKSSRSASSRDSTQLHAPLTPPTSATSLTPPILDASNSPDSQVSFDNGTAIIYRPRSPSLPLVIDSDDIAVEIPDYALDLFSGFDFNCEIPRTSLEPIPDVPSSPSPTAQRKSSRNSMPILHRLHSPPSSKDTRKSSLKLGRSSSQRHLGKLFSIPEAVSSDNVGRSEIGLLSRESDNPSLATSGPLRSVTSLGETNEKKLLGAIFRKRLAGIRLKRS